MRHELFMQRCLDLARLGAGSVSPNPMVGAVLVHGGRIIGEGWHRQYGKAHAEVNCLASVRENDRPLIPDSTLYVSLEPCCIHGNTPPCTDLILRCNIKRVVISCLDQTPQVSGRGVSILREAGVAVETGVLEQEGQRLSRFRNTYVSQKRPYVLLKFAGSKDGYLGRAGEQVWISNPVSKRLTHRWRAELDAILIGTNTARTDNPQLTNRLWFGKSPVRIVLDRNASLPPDLVVFDASSPTWWVTDLDKTPGQMPGNVLHVPLSFGESLLPLLFDKMYEARLTSLMVEGGAKTLQAFIDAGCWDEAAIFTGTSYLGQGIPAPVVPGAVWEEIGIAGDVLTMFRIYTAGR